MDVLYKADEYVQKLLDIKNNYTTYYAWGAFGAPANAKNKTRYKVPKAPADAFLFDCGGFVYKALPWGWCADRNKTYGGATYMKVPEVESTNVIGICSDVSTDFSNIVKGELLYMKGHVGLYIGDGKAIECTSKWTRNVLISEVKNTKINTGLSYKRTWLKHGKLPFLDYSAVTNTKASAQATDSTDSIINTTYIVQKGDSLWKIAKKYLGSGTKYKKIMEANNLKTSTLKVGQKLIIPKA